MVHEMTLDFREVIFGVPWVDFTHKVILSQFSFGLFVL